MVDTFALAPAPTAGGLFGKRTAGPAPARGTGARRSSDDEGLGAGDGVAVDGDRVGAGDGRGDDVALGVMLAVVEADDTAGPAPLLQDAASSTEVATRTPRTGLT
jgi:hypothetical protein